MAFTTVRDSVIWAKHLEDGKELVERILALPEGGEISLMIDKMPARFLKMKNGRDGRATPGIKLADTQSRQFWNAIQARRGDVVTVELAEKKFFGLGWLL